MADYNYKRSALAPHSSQPQNTRLDNLSQRPITIAWYFTYQAYDKHIHGPPSLNFCLNLAKAYGALVRRFDGRLGTLHGLSFGDFAMLLQLSRAPGVKLRRVDLANQLGLTASAVTRALIPLERIGLVKRERDLRDARVGYAVLTKTGERVVKESSRSAEAISEDLVPGGNLAELERLSRALLQIAG